MLLKIPSGEPRRTVRAASTLLQLMPSGISQQSSERRPDPVTARWRKEVAKEAASQGSVATVSGGCDAIAPAWLPDHPAALRAWAPRKLDQR